MARANTETFIIFQHSNGIGHFARCSTLAQALGDISHVTMFSGGKPIPESVVPSGVDFVQLPATGWDMTANVAPVPVDPGYTVAEIDRVRSEMLVESYARLRPRVVILDYFPFSPQRF